MDIFIGLQCAISYTPNGSGFAQAELTFGEEKVEGLRSFVFSTDDEASVGEVEFHRTSAPPVDLIRYLEAKRVRVLFYPPVARRTVPKNECRVVVIPSSRVVNDGREYDPVAG